MKLSKLEKLLADKNIVISKKFIIDDQLAFLQLTNTETTDNFFVYVQSKYVIKIPNDSKNTYSLDYLSIGDNYIESNHNSNYEEIELNYKEHLNITKELEDNYDHEIELKTIEDKDLIELNQIKSQLSRIKLCVKTLKYKIIIIYKNYICSIRRDNDLEFFKILSSSDQFSSENKLILPVVDIENLILNLETIKIDIKSVYDGIINNLSINRKKLTNNLKFLFTLGDGLDGHISTVNLKIHKYNTEYNKFLDLYKKLNTKDKYIYNEIKKIKNRPYKSIDDSMKNKAYLENKISEYESVKVLKNDIMSNMQDSKHNIQNLIINSDRILFDNIVILDRFVKNIRELENF